MIFEIKSVDKTKHANFELVCISTPLIGEEVSIIRGLKLKFKQLEKEEQKEIFK